MGFPPSLFDWENTYSQDERPAKVSISVSMSAHIFAKKFFFKTVDLIICHFLWNGKTPRVRQKVLQNCKFYGGFSLPNFLFYYWAANITKIIFLSKSTSIPWCQLEARSYPPVSLSALLTGPITANSSGLTCNPVVTATLKIWFQFRKQFKFTTPQF